MHSKIDRLAHCGSEGSELSLLYAQDILRFSYSSLDPSCHNYYTGTPVAVTPTSPYSVYPGFSYDEELGFRIKTEQVPVFMEHPQVHHPKEGITDPWIHSPQFPKSEATGMPLHEIPEHLMAWSKITPPISPSHHDQPNEQEPEALRIPFVPSKGRKRRSTSKSGRTRARNSRNNSSNTILPDPSSPGPGIAVATPGSKGIEGSIMYQLLYELRETRQLPWKACAEVIKKRGKAYKVPALQMRYKRLKDRAVVWEAEDVRIHPNI